MRKTKIIETKEIIEQAIWQWYFERGLDVPKWKMQKDPDWWTDYLREIGDE